MRYLSIHVILLLFGLSACISDNKTLPPSPEVDETRSTHRTKSENEANQHASTKSVVSTDIKATNKQFEIIQSAHIPPYEDVIYILRKSNLAQVCGEQGVDQLDIDLMFLKSGTMPFDQFKVTQLKDGTQRRYMDLFNEKDLKIFYEEARKYLKKNQSK